MIAEHQVPALKILKKYIKQAPFKTIREVSEQFIKYWARGPGGMPKSPKHLAQEHSQSPMIAEQQVPALEISKKNIKQAPFKAIIEVSEQFIKYWARGPGEMPKSPKRLAREHSQSPMIAEQQVPALEISKKNIKQAPFKTTIEASDQFIKYWARGPGGMPKSPNIFRQDQNQSPMTAEFQVPALKDLSSSNSPIGETTIIKRDKCFQESPQIHPSSGDKTG
jgi:hypothetical protein